MAFSDEDDDAAFFSHAGDAVLGKRKRSAAANPLELSSDGSESSGSETRSKPVTPKRGAKAAAGTPDQQLGSSLIAPVHFYEISSDDESRAQAATKARKRQMSQKRRANSLTPPPEIQGVRRSVQDMQAAAKKQQRAQQEIMATAAAESPSRPTKTEAELALERELSVRQRTRALTRPASGTLSPTLPNGNDDGDTLIEVLVRGIYVALPDEQNGRTTVSWNPPNRQLWEQAQRFRLKRSTPLRAAKAHFCAQCGVRPADVEQHVIMAYGSVQIFRSMSCAALRIRAGSEELPMFELYTRQGWQYVTDHPDLAKELREQSAQLQRPNDGLDGQQGNGHTDGDGAGSDAEAQERIMLTLRGKNNIQLKIQTRPSTQIKKLIEAFRQNQKLGAGTKIRLMVEGEALQPDSIVGSADVESGDVIDVHVE